jgi:hypothetical protein
LSEEVESIMRGGDRGVIKMPFEENKKAPSMIIAGINIR